MRLPRGLLKRLIREGYSAPDAMREAWKRVRKNPGAKWHGKEATRAEGERYSAEGRGSFIGAHYYRGKREAHRESQAESRRMGLNPREDIPYKVGARVKYRREFLRSIAWYTNVPRAGTVVSLTKMGKELWPTVQWDEFFPEPIMVNPANVMLAKRPDVNPGAAWHEEEETEERASRARMEVRGRPVEAQYFRGRGDAHRYSAQVSRQMGLNPRPSAIPAHKLATANRYLNLIRNAKKRQYGFALLSWLKGGAVGNTPEAPAGLSVMAAQAVRLELDAMKLWENPRGAKTVVGRVFRAKRWAKRWARGRPVRRVKGGWQVQAGRKRTPAQELAHRRTVRRNPIAVYNPPPGRMIYGQVLAVQARKTNGTYRGKSFQHKFSPASRVAMYALPDGSVLLKSGAGKRLWADR